MPNSFFFPSSVCSEGQIVTVQEGANFEICSSRDGEFSTGDISVNIVEGKQSTGMFPSLDLTT